MCTKKVLPPRKLFLWYVSQCESYAWYTFSMYFLILAACKGFSTLSYSFSIYYVVLILVPCKGFPSYVALLFLITLFSFSDSFALALFHWILVSLFWYVKMLLKILHKLIWWFYKIEYCNAPTNSDAPTSGICSPPY